MSSTDKKKKKKPQLGLRRLWWKDQHKH